MLRDVRFQYGLYQFDNIAQVEVKKSTIQGAGNGVFVTQDTREYSIISFYSGEVQPYDPLGCDDNECMYDVLLGELEGGIYKCVGFPYDSARIEVKKRQSLSKIKDEPCCLLYNVGQLCNDPRDKRVNAEIAFTDRNNIPGKHLEKSLYTKYNHKTKQHHYIDIPVVFVYCLKPLKKGEEVFISYGTGYW